MELTAHILMYVFLIMFVNSGLKHPFEKLTMYKKSDLSSQPGWFVIMFVFFGVFMFLFVRQIRQFRKMYHIRNSVSNYEFWCLGHGLRPPEDQMDFEGKWPKPSEPFDRHHEEYLNNKRYLKLRKLQKKSKRKCII